MARKKPRDYRTIITINDKEHKFNTLKEASEYLNISEAALKMRCGQNKTVDGITYKWANPKSHMGRRNKQKGNSFEREIINNLKKIGYTDCVSARWESKRTDDGGIDIVDPSNKLPVNIQCKYTVNTPNYFKLQEDCKFKDKPFVITWKKSTTDGTNSPGTVAIIPIQEFYNYLGLLNKELENEDEK